MPTGRARLLLRGMLWSQLGQGLPVLAALILIPQLVRGLGVDRFGVLSLAWLLIGYFTLFDLGVSGALTRMVSERLANGRSEENPRLIWTALGLTVMTGAVGGLVLAALAPTLVHRVLHLTGELGPETLRLTLILAATLPVVTGTAALTGVLAAYQRFGAINAVRVPLGVLTYAAPVAVLSFSSGLVAAGAALAAVRVVAGFAYLALCLALVPGLTGRPRLGAELVRPILGFGGWMTVSAVVGPFMVYLDRFLIGAMQSVTMVAYYTTPYDMVSRLSILSTPIVQVLFPSFAASFPADPPRAARLLDWGARAVAVLLFPFALVLVLFAPEGLKLWLGADFALHGTSVLRLLAIGVFLNGLGQVALALVQGSGRPEMGARLHLAEMPFYVVALWFLLRSRGIEGAAIAWLARIGVDTVALVLLARSRIGRRTGALRGPVIAGGAGVLALATACLVPSLPARVGYGVVVLGVFASVAWRSVLRPGMRAAFAPPGAGAAS